MSFTVKYHSIISPDFRGSFQKIYDSSNLGLKAAYQVKKLAEELDGAMKSFHAKREEVYKNIEQLEQEKAEETFKKEMTEFGDKEITLSVDKISLRSLESLKLSGHDLTVLEPLLNDDFLRLVK